MKLYRRGKIWWCTVGGADRKRFSTGTEDYEKAKEEAERMAGPLRYEDSAELLERAARLRDRSRKELQMGKRLDSIFDSGEYQRKHGVKPSVVYSAGYFWGRFIRYCQSEGVDTADQLTRDVCSSFIGTMKSRSGQVASVFCRQILADSGIDCDYFVKPRRKAGDVVHREPLTREQIDAILADVDAKAEKGYPSDAAEFAAYIRTLLYTGLRMGDAVTLEWEMVDLDEMTISRIMEKTGRRVDIPLNKALGERLAMIRRDGDGYVFPSLARLYNHNNNDLSIRIRRMLDRCRINGKPGQYCAHCFRTTFASLCAENGVPLAVIQSWLGHTSPMVTRIYARIEDMKRKREALSRFPNLG